MIIKESLNNKNQFVIDYSSININKFNINYKLNTIHTIAYENKSTLLTSINYNTGKIIKQISINDQNILCLDYDKSDTYLLLAS